MPPKTRGGLSSAKPAVVRQYQRRDKRSQTSPTKAVPPRRQSSRLQAFGRRAHGLPPATSENPIEIGADGDDTPVGGDRTDSATEPSVSSSDRSTTEEQRSMDSSPQTLGTEEPQSEPPIEQRQGTPQTLGTGELQSERTEDQQPESPEPHPLGEGALDPSFMQIVIWEPQPQPLGKETGHEETTRSGGRAKRIAKKPPRPPRKGKGNEPAHSRRKRPRPSPLAKGSTPSEPSIETAETETATADTPPLGKGVPSTETEATPGSTHPLGEGQAPADQLAASMATPPRDRPSTSGSDSPILRTRPRVGGKPTIPSDSALGGCLKFVKARYVAQYAQIRNRPVVSARRIDIATLDHLGIRTGVQALIDNIGWHEFFQLNEPVYVELVKEFYATFEYTRPKPLDLDAPSMSFRLLTERFTLSINEFTTMLGLDHTAACSEIPNDFSGATEYADMCNDPDIVYNSSKSKDVCIIDPCVKYVHRFLAYNFSCRLDNPGLVSKTELFFLSSMVKGRKVHLGYWLATQFYNALKTGNRPLILGHIITHFAHRQQLIPSDIPLFSLGPLTPLDMRSLEDMRLIRIVQGTSSFVSAGTAPPEEPQGQEDASPSAASTSAALLKALAEEVAGMKRELDRQATQLHRVEGMVRMIAEKMGISPPAEDV